LKFSALLNFKRPGTEFSVYDFMLVDFSIRVNSFVGKSALAFAKGLNQTSDFSSKRILYMNRFGKLTESSYCESSNTIERSFFQTK